MDLVTRLLIGTLVATGIFVAVVSGCGPSVFLGVADGGSCAETRFEPFVPSPAMVMDAPAIPRVLQMFAVILLAAILIPRTNRAVDGSARRRSRAGPSHSQPFYRMVFLPYLFATRDP